MGRSAIRLIFVALATVLARAQSPSPGPTPDRKLIEALHGTVSRAIGSYNSVDAAGIRRQFSAQAPGLPDEAAFRRLFFRYYLEVLGRAESMRIVPGESNPDPDRAMLVYDAGFDLWPRVKVSANFIREGGVPKLVQLRFEKVE